MAEDIHVPAGSQVLAVVEGNSALVPAEFPSPEEGKAAVEELAEEASLWAEADTPIPAGWQEPEVRVGEGTRVLASSALPSAEAGEASTHVPVRIFWGLPAEGNFEEVQWVEEEEGIHVPDIWVESA